MMHVFSEGQRWVSDTEPDLGLGTIIDNDPRQVTVVFMASGQTRIYSKESAPLTRIRFIAGDQLQTHDRRDIKVSEVVDDDGFLTYIGHDEAGDHAIIPESELNNFLTFNRPQDRLFAGQLDKRKWFNLRRDVFTHRFDIERSVIRGLMGARISIIPHQIHIANEVSRRQAPRVLLADEVGLGKTIEAGLILHSQLANNQIRRVLVVVPTTLVHQWLVEMLRRFNLHFHIMDEERYDALLPSSPDDNPFLSEQLILCSLDTLTGSPDIAEAATQGQFDMLVVDEAHHLNWTPENASPAYELIESIAGVTPATLLLTATPLQLGAEGHFARLRLLDPNRFSDYSAFLAEEAAFESIAKLAQMLLSGEPLTAGAITQLNTLNGIALTDSDHAALLDVAEEDSAGMDARHRILSVLNDHHGTSRVLFRNTRSAITGFPERKLFQYSLAQPTTPNHMADWLVDFLRDRLPEKVLLICHSNETVLALAEALRITGTQSAVFHEGMSIVERDRAAAWFADDEDGCQILLCSEIGSEGRNFQFLHHLVTYELPLNPDVLEQRIGRLDRIGQRETVCIHVPTQPNSLDAKLALWYHEGLNAFESIGKTGSAVAAQLEPAFSEVMLGEDTPPDSLESLITETQSLAHEMELALENGRDRLLELNSNRVESVDEHMDELYRLDRSYQLPDFMARVFDSFGVDVEEQSDRTWIIKPSDHMQVASFPGLEDGGMTVTFSRDSALTREELTYLTWDHPMVIAAMDLVLSEAFGQANAEVINTDLLPKGVLFVEGIVTWRCTAQHTLNVERYLPVATKRFLLGSNRKDYTSVLDQLDIDSMLTKSSARRLRPVLEESRPHLSVLLNYIDKLGSQAVPEIVASASAAIDTELNAEIDRLVALRETSTLVREDEIARLYEKQAALQAALAETRHELVALSVLINP